MYRQGGNVLPAWNVSGRHTYGSKHRNSRCFAGLKEEIWRSGRLGLQSAIAVQIRGICDRIPDMTLS